MVSSCPVLWACDVAMVCRSRRNSVICDSMALLFWRPCKVSKASQITRMATRDRKSTRLNSSHEWISYAVFCLKKKKIKQNNMRLRMRNGRCRRKKGGVRLDIVEREMVRAQSRLSRRIRLQDQAQ